jgi:hypothetical protein
VDCEAPLGASRQEGNDVTEEAGLGHNKPPLEDRIFADPDVTEADVIAVVMARLKRGGAEALAENSARAKQLAANAKRLPTALDEKTAIAALELLAALDVHAERAEAVREALVDMVKKAAADATALCKPLDAGLAPLEKGLRPLFVEYLTKELDRHNAERTPGEQRMPSITVRGPSGSKATLTDAYQTVVTDAAAVEREYCVPDMALIEAAIAEGKKVSGTGRERCPTLRVTK